MSTPRNVDSSSTPRLRDRRMVQWGLAYLGGAWLVLQVLDVFAEPWNVPAAVQRLVGVLLGMGFLATLVLSWFHGERGRQRTSGTELLVLEERFMLGHHWRGGTRLRTGDVDGAVESFARAVELSDSSAITVAGLARGFAEAGRVDEARRLLPLHNSPSSGSPRRETDTGPVNCPPRIRQTFEPRGPP